jgi:hypothetical protein
MTALYMIYGLLIVLAIVIWPLRIRARKQTLKEIDRLRSTLQANTKQLVSRINEISLFKPEQYEKSLEKDIGLHSFLAKCESFPPLLESRKYPWISTPDCWIALNDYRTSRPHVHPTQIIFKFEREEKYGWMGGVKSKRLMAPTSYESSLATV